MMVPKSTTLFMTSLCCIAYSTVQGVTMKSTPIDVRGLQANQTFTYRATYTADFQHLTDSACTADKPELQLSCYGVNLTILSVSDPSIVCTPREIPAVRNGITYTCVNTCVDCTSVYAASNDIIDGPFASIVFMCEGDDIRHVDALYTFIDGNIGRCEDTTATQSRNYHVGRLGVSCPNGTSREFVYDDTYVECIFGRSTSPGFAFDLTPELDGIDTYTCISGDNCDGAECSVPFDEIDFYSQAIIFAETCVESLNDMITIPTPAPQISSASTRYRVVYEASWGQHLSSSVSGAGCTSTNPAISVKCKSDSLISYINSTDLLMECVNLSSSELSCVGDVTALRSPYTTVTYTCVGPTASPSIVTFPEASASCLSNVEDVVFSNYVTIGTLCDGDYLYGDSAQECADAAHNFDYGTFDFGLYVRYACSESATFEEGSTSSQIIRNVTIGIQKSWIENQSTCYEILATPTAPTVPVAPPPVTASPTASPTEPPIEPLSMSPTTSLSVTVEAPMGGDGTRNIPTTIPISAPVSLPDGGGDSIVGIAIGSAVGGVAVAAVIGFLIFFMKRNQTGLENKPTNESHYTESNTNDDDFMSSRQPATPQPYMGYSATAALVQPPPRNEPPLPLYPVTEVPSKNLNVQAMNHSNPKREVLVPPPDMPGSGVRTSLTGQSGTSSHRLSYPTNHVPDFKDQSRSVAMVRSSSPTFISQADSNIPFAVALGVSTATTPSVNSSTSSTNKKEPAGRILNDV